MKKHGLITSMIMLAMGSAGSASPTQALQLKASSSDALTTKMQLVKTQVRRQAPISIKGTFSRASGISGHFELNQRQRRKFNRQRHAAGIKNAFN